MRVAVYVRTSTSQNQSCESQLSAIQRYVDQRDGWVITRVFEDHGVSGDKRSRPELDRLFRLAEREDRDFDVVITMSISRWGRSLSGVVTSLDKCRSLDLKFVSLKESVDTSEESPYSTMLIAIFASLAEIQLQCIRDAVAEGVRRAQEKGVRFGRPQVSVEIGDALQMKKQGKSLREISHALPGRPSIATLSRRFKELEQAGCVVS